MSDYDDDERPRRENLMQQRLRKARGEEVDEDLSVGGRYADDDDRPRGLGGYAPSPRSYGGGGGGGCAQVTLYLVLGGLATLLLGGLFLSRAIGDFGRVLTPPPIAEILATPTPEVITGAAVVQRIQQLSRLETASYSIQTVIDVSQGSNIPVIGDLLAGDELLLIAHGTVVAGVDLGTLAPDAVTVTPDGSTITVRLPPAQVFSASLDSQKTRVYSRERGIFAPENKDLETQARQVAEEEILRAACEDGVLSKATLQAEAALRQFLGLVDDAEVVVIPAAPGPCVAPAGSAPQPTATP
jgi:Protein of unknown function (DUF4230)